MIQTLIIMSISLLKIRLLLEQLFLIGSQTYYEMVEIKILRLEQVSAIQMLQPLSLEQILP